uniref:Ig-like domain-containing protein n=1 Tax=Magallana gigas TaxID=29159 RepID=A0A8W8LHH6_MAGGI|nr:uncharacterized protein LOC117681442 [Crassostrea gigas]XP_034301839.1 uncharacterized protein LOC117681442 [Crassostrea gigas]
MTLAIVWSVLSLISHALTQDIQIQALPPKVTIQENDLVVLCSIINSSRLQSLFFIELSRNATVNFTTVVSVLNDDEITWADSALQSRGAAAMGSLDFINTPYLRFTMNKDIVQCPDDFKMYKCKMSGVDSLKKIVTKESAPINIAHKVKPTVMEMPRVKILNEVYNTPYRQFPMGVAIQLTCEGQIGSDPSTTIRWCVRKEKEEGFKRWAQSAVHSEASPSGCQYTRSSTITYNLTRDDTFTRFMCESGNTGTCGTGTAIQYVNITIIRPTLIEKPRVRILNELNDTTKRQFPVRRVLQLTCKGQIGSDPNNTIGWCVQKENEEIFTKLDQAPLHSNASFNGSQYIRSSTITYILTSQDTFTKFLCESGDTGVCGTGTAIQYVNISITDPVTNYGSENDTSDAGKIAGGVIVGLALIALIIVLVVWKCRRKIFKKCRT